MVISSYFDIIHYVFVAVFTARIAYAAMTATATKIEKYLQCLKQSKWKNFQTESLPINVKLWGPFNWTFNRELLWSAHGPVVKTNHGTYALRYSGSDMIGQVEQWFRMNKATNLEEFTTAMKMMQIPMFNTLYADKKGKYQNQGEGQEKITFAKAK